MSEPCCGSDIASIHQEDSTRSKLEQAQLTTALFCAFMAIALSICYAVVQPDILRGFEQTRNSLAVSLCLLLLPQGYRDLQRLLKPSIRTAKQTTAPTDVGLDAILLLLSLIACIGFSWIQIFLSTNLIPLFWGLALVLLSTSVWRFVPQKLTWEHLIVGVIAIAFYAYLGWMVWGLHGYMTPRPVGKLLTESLHIDTLFHSSIAAMIRTYGIPSTGLNGPVYLPYHTGSHWLFAQLANLIDLSIFRFYNLAYPILIMPFFFRSILAFVVDLRAFGSSALSTWDLRKDWLFWGLLVVCFIGFLPTSLLLQLGIGLTSPLISQSHLLALSLSFLTLCLCLRLIHQYGKEQFSLAVGSLILGISLLLGFVTLSKVSIGFLLFSVLLYTVIRLQLYLRWPIGVGLGIAFLLQFVALKYMGYFGGDSTDSTPIQLFAYFREYVDPSVQVFSLPVLFAWSLAYLVLRLRAIRLYTISDLAKAGQAGITIDAEIVILICLLGITPGLLLQITGGGAYYFMDFQMWFSLSLLLGAAYHSPLWQHLVNLGSKP